jgi:hypothetical protein
MIDINDSEVFLRHLFHIKKENKTQSALDVAGGVGRISKDLLSKYFG